MNEPELGGARVRRRRAGRSRARARPPTGADEPGPAVDTEPQPPLRPGAPSQPAPAAASTAAQGAGSEQLEVVDLEGVAVARLAGEVDVAAAPALEDQLVGVAGPGEGLIVDLSGLRYLDSSAVRSLFRVADHLASGGGRLHVVVPRDSRLVRVLQIIQLDTVVAVHDDLAEARRALRGDRPPRGSAEPTAN